MTKIFGGALGLLLVAAPVFAHHSAVMFDDQKEITVKGVVKEFQYTNPHSWLLVDVKNNDGTVTTWGFEAEGPSTLTRAGIRKSDLMPHRAQSFAPTLTALLSLRRTALSRCSSCNWRAGRRFRRRPFSTGTT